MKGCCERERGREGRGRGKDKWRGSSDVMCVGVEGTNAQTADRENSQFYVYFMQMLLE